MYAHTLKLFIYNYDIYYFIIFAINNNLSYNKISSYKKYMIKWVFFLIIVYMIFI